MDFVRDHSEVRQNIRYLRDCLSASGPDAEFAKKRLALGICFVVDELNGRVFFAPSRFVAYKSNSKAKHRGNRSKHGSRTNEVLSRIFRDKPKPDPELSKEYFRFLRRNGILPEDAPFRGVRKFWDVRE